MDLASALIGKRKKFHEMLAEQAASTAPQGGGFAAALARALQGGLAGVYERQEKDEAGEKFDKLFGEQGVPDAPARPPITSGQPSPELLARALRPDPADDAPPPMREPVQRPMQRASVMPGAVPSPAPPAPMGPMGAPPGPGGGEPAGGFPAERFAAALDPTRAAIAKQRDPLNPMNMSTYEVSDPDTGQITATGNLDQPPGPGVPPPQQAFAREPMPQPAPQMPPVQAQPPAPVRMAQAPMPPDGAGAPRENQMPPPRPPQGAPASAPRAQPQIPPQIMQQARQLYIENGPAAAAALLQPYMKPRDEWVALTDPQDRARAGIQPSDTNPYQRNAAGEVKAINPQPFAVNVNQQGQSEFEKEYGQGIGKRALATIERGDLAAIQQQRIQLAQRMLQDIDTGKLTPAQATVGGWLQAFGMKPEALGIPGDLPMTAEALTALTSELVVGKIGAGGFPANNFSNPDREFLVQGVFKLADRPEANFIKLEVARRVAQLDAQKADAWAGARAEKQSYEEFERDWRKTLQSQNVFGDLVEQAKAFGEATGARPAPSSQPQRPPSEPDADGWVTIDGVRIRKRQ